MRADISEKSGRYASSVSNWSLSHLLPVYLTITLLILFPYIWRLWILEVREFDQDEFEHFHAVWCVFKGMLPYRDFFENHTPWLYYLFAPFLGFFDVERSVADAFGFIFLARQAMWFFTGAILLLTFWLGKLWRNYVVALVGTLFLINTAIFLDKTLEFRPDQLSTIFWLGCLAMVLRGVKTETADASWTRWQFVSSGMLLGAGVMATQKILLLLPGFAAAMSFYILDSRAHGNRLARSLNIVYQVAGFVSPIFLTVVYFYLHNGLAEFLDANFFFNLTYKSSGTPYRDLRALVNQNPYLVCLGAAGLVSQCTPIFRRVLFSSEDAVLFFTCLGSLAGLFLHPEPHPQAFLTFLPLLSLFAGMTLIKCLERLTTLRDQVDVSKWTTLVVAGSLPILLVLAVFCRPHVAAFWFGALLIGLFFIFVRASNLALVAFLILLSIPPQVRTHGSLQARNTSQLDGIRYVIENTKPTDTVMDGFTGSGLFRPHAYFYYAINYVIRLVLTDKDWDNLLNDLESGRIAPKLIIFDKDLQALPPPITAFFKEHYQHVGKEDIWQRK